jgi:hypothetical protein
VTDFLLWLAFGAVLGFLRARRKLAASFQQSTQIIDSIENPVHMRYGRGRLQGYRLGIYLLYAGLGAIGGGLIWGAATLLVRVGSLIKSN